MRFLSEKGVRRYLAKKSGAESGAFHYNQDLTGTRKRLAILPKDLEYVSIFLPLLLELSRSTPKESFHILCEQSYQPLLKSIGLEAAGLYFDPSKNRYGDPNFQLLENKLRALAPEVCLMLEPKPDLLQLYLARASSATWRIGLASEEHYPFLNISFHPEGASAYSFRRNLQSIFGLSDAAQDHPFAHNPEQLSSRHVILLNLEPSVSGKPWTSEEISEVANHLDPHFRLLSLAPDPKHLEPYAPMLERLSIRSAPMASSYTAFLDLLRQYHGMISLNSAHAQLAINVSHIPTLLIAEPATPQWLPPSSPELFIFERGKPLRKEDLLPLTSGKNH